MPIINQSLSFNHFLFSDSVNRIEAALILGHFNLLNLDTFFCRHTLLERDADAVDYAGNCWCGERLCHFAFESFSTGTFMRILRKAK